MADLDPSTRQVISDRMAASEALSGDYEKDEKAGFFKDFKPTEYNFGLQAGNDAIANKAKAKFYDPAIDNILTQQKAGYAQKVQNQMKSAQQLGMGQLRYDNARALAAQQRVAQEEAQRAAMISSLFQVGGAAVGGFFGGPAGAGAGAQVGGAVGNQAGGAQAANTQGNTSTPGRMAY